VLSPQELFGEAAWDLPRTLNSLDTLLWRCEAEPRLRSPLVAVFVLEHTPDWRRFAAGHEWASRMVPRLRDRAAASHLHPTAPCWTPDPEFDPARHVRRMALPGAAGERELLDEAERALTAPFDWNRPPWESVLVEKVIWGDRPRAAWLLRFHHCLADGAVFLSWINGLLSRSAEPRRDKPQPPAPPRRARVFPGLDLLLEAGESLSGTVRASTAGRTLHDLAIRPVGPPSPLLAGRSLNRRVEVLKLPTAELMATARRLNAPLRDLFVTGLLGGFHRYHLRAGQHLDTLGLAVPLPLRTGPARAGNRFGGLRLAAPMGEADPRSRLEKIRAQLAEAEAAFCPAAADALLAVARTLPTPVLTALGLRLGRGYDVQLSVCGGFFRPLYVSGAAVVDLFAAGPLPGCAGMGLVIPRQTGSVLGLTLDPAAVPDPAGLLECLAEGFAETVELAARLRPVA
jgi:WS/DGAT/MGAT family acyltransferase